MQRYRAAPPLLSETDVITLVGGYMPVFLRSLDVYQQRPKDISAFMGSLGTIQDLAYQLASSLSISNNATLHMRLQELEQYWSTDLSWDDQVPFLVQIKMHCVAQYLKFKIKDLDINPLLLKYHCKSRMEEPMEE